MDFKEFLKKHKLREGDLVEIFDGKQTMTGTVLPESELNKRGFFALKMKSGYNIGVKISPQLKVKKFGKIKTVGKPKTISIKKNPALPTIAILHTGGTIASRVDYRTGAVVSSFTPEDLLSMFPELSEIANFETELIEEMWSDDLRFKHFELIGKAVEKHIKKGVKGVMIGMGTDNMAVAAAAMAFVLENCPVPVLFVGAQRSSDRGSSDAAMNLICATEFIKKTDFAGVAICMHDFSSDEWCAILPACKTRKMHSSRRDAFKAINTTPIARVNFKTREIQFIQKDFERKNEKKKLILKPKFEDKTALLKIHINMQPEIFAFFKKQKYKGLVIEGTGLGHTPGYAPDKIAAPNKKIIPTIKELVKSGCIVVMTTQCLYGRVHMHVYNKGTDLLEAGVIPGEDMLPETAFVKLAWLLGNYPKEKVKELIGKNLRGEITPSTNVKAFDLE